MYSAHGTIPCPGNQRFSLWERFSKMCSPRRDGKKTPKFVKIQKCLDLIVYTIYPFPHTNSAQKTPQMHRRRPPAVRAPGPLGRYGAHGPEGPLLGPMLHMGPMAPRNFKQDFLGFPRPSLQLLRALPSQQYRTLIWVCGVPWSPRAYRVIAGGGGGSGTAKFHAEASGPTRAPEGINKECIGKRIPVLL